MEVLQFFSRLLKPLLFPFSLLYGLAVWLRNKVYDKGIYASIEFSLPVISVGNLSTGGTGKTPHIEYLIALLQYEFQVATMSRGYKRRSSGFQVAGAGADAYLLGDEPMQFHQKFRDAIVTVCEDRMTGIPELIGRYPQTEVILLDDAYQHRSVKPGLNILVMDFQKPFYKDHILPFGSLREGRRRYDRADIIIVSKCPETLSETGRQEMVKLIKPFPNQKIFFTKTVYKGFLDFYTHGNAPLPPKANLVLVSGIANPSPLLGNLRGQSNYVHLLGYPDHHYFTQKDLEEIKETFDKWQESSKIIVTTEKDAMRLSLHIEQLREWGLPILVAPIQIEFIAGQDDFNNCIYNYIQKEKEEQIF
jgi:tetraacyldisaccharide 4'-kinase